MEAVLPEIDTAMTEQQDKVIRETAGRERKRLLDFIRTRIPDPTDAEDILQDVFYEMVQMVRMMQPVSQMTSWLFTVARNKITDRYRKKKPVSFSQVEKKINVHEEGEEHLSLQDLIPSGETGPETVQLRKMIMEELEEALMELPDEQREVFVLHELEGISFQQIAEQTGLNVNTLLSRKRYAVLYLRGRLSRLYNELLNEQ